MVTDIGGIDRAHFAGIDNYRAGRTAGYYIGRLAARPGRVLLLGGRMGYRAHADRMAGCRDQLAEAFAAVRCDDEPVETLDQDDRCYRAVTKALQAHDDVVAIYNSGAGSAGIEAALRKAGAAGRVVWIGHEMIDLHRTFIESGAMDLAIEDPDGDFRTAARAACVRDRRTAATGRSGRIPRVLSGKRADERVPAGLNSNARHTVCRAARGLQKSTAALAIFRQRLSCSPRRASVHWAAHPMTTVDRRRWLNRSSSA